MSTKPLTARLLCACILIVYPTLVLAKGPGKDGPIQSGYAVITPKSGASSGLVVFEAFGQTKGNGMTQAAVLAGGLTVSANLFVNTSGRLSRDLGVALANPGSADSVVTLTLRSDDGSPAGTKTITVNAHNQISQLITEMFSDVADVPKDFTGTLNVSADNPVAVVGLRFRGENFSTIPVVSSSPVAVPVITSDIGGPGAVILPQFVTGGGWAAQIVIMNTSTADTVRVDLFRPDGTPLTAELNGQSASSFVDLPIPAHGILILTPLDEKGDSDF